MLLQKWKTTQKARIKENKVEETDYDVVILGAGPAGISAGLYAHRGGLKTLILNNPASGSALSQAHMISNYYGFPDGITGKDFVKF